MLRYSPQPHSEVEGEGADVIFNSIIPTTPSAHRYRTLRIDGHFAVKCDSYAPPSSMEGGGGLAEGGDRRSTPAAVGDGASRRQSDEIVRAPPANTSSPNRAGGMGGLSRHAAAGLRDVLTPEEFERVNAARRDVFRAAAKGFGVGLVVGPALFVAAKRGLGKTAWRANIEGWGAVIGCGAAGAIANASLHGQMAAGTVHDVLRKRRATARPAPMPASELELRRLEAKEEADRLEEAVFQERRAARVAAVEEAGQERAAQQRLGSAWDGKSFWADDPKEHTAHRGARE